MHAQATDTPGARTLALVSHVPIFASAARAWQKEYVGHRPPPPLVAHSCACRYYIVSVFTYIAAFTSLFYHLCGGFDVCSGRLPEELHMADRLTAPSLIYAFVWVLFETRDLWARLFSDLLAAAGRRRDGDDDERTPLPPPSDVVRSLDVIVAPPPVRRPVAWRVEPLDAPPPPSLIYAEMQTVPETHKFATIEDMPVYRALQFVPAALGFQVMVLAFSILLFPLDAWPLYMALLAVLVTTVAYVLLFRPIPPERRRRDTGQIVPRDHVPLLRYQREWAIFTVVPLPCSMKTSSMTCSLFVGPSPCERPPLWPQRLDGPRQ